MTLANWPVLAETGISTDAILHRYSANIPLFLCETFHYFSEVSTLRWTWRARSLRLVCHVRNLVTPHHRAQCEVYSLWVSQSQQQSNSKASETESTLQKEYFISLLRPSQRQMSRTRSLQQGEKVSLSQLWHQNKFPKYSSTTHIYIIFDKCAFSPFLISMEKIINAFPAYLGDLAEYFSLPMFLFYASLQCL